MILYSKEPQYFASICQLIVTLYWICTIWDRECVIGLIQIILMYLRVPHFFNIHVDCGVHTLPNYCNEHFKPYLIYHIHDMCSFCILLFAPPCHTPPSLSVAADFVPKKLQPNLMLQAATLVYHHPPLLETDLLYQLIVV